jgi:hypothetical protein
MTAHVTLGQQCRDNAAPGGPHGTAWSGRIRRMRRLMVLLLVMAVAGCGDGDATETGATEQFTQGGVSMEPTVKAGQVVTARTITGTYERVLGNLLITKGHATVGRMPW